MANLVQNSIRIKQTFDDILSAIKYKGVTPTDESDVSTYASAIDEIEASVQGIYNYEEQMLSCGYSGSLGTQAAYDFDGRTSSYKGMKHTISSAYDNMDLFIINDVIYGNSAGISSTSYLYLNGVEVPMLVYRSVSSGNSSWYHRLSYYNVHVKQGDVLIFRTYVPKSSISGSLQLFWRVYRNHSSI